MKAKDFLYKLILFSWLSMIVFKYFKQVENRHLFLNFPQRSDVHPKLLGETEEKERNGEKQGR